MRRRVETLAADGGEYRVVCGKTGESPVPVAGRRFPDRGTAAAAARAGMVYRAVLCEYDPRAPVYELIVCETAAADGSAVPEGVRAGEKTA
jgi:hypothetical protein